MARRFVVGFVKGALVGVLMSLAWSRVFGGGAFAGAASYLLAIVTGALTGLLAGKPFWAKGALVENVVKGVVGSLVGGAGLYAMDKWLPVNLNLGPLGAGQLGDVAQFALLAIALAIGVVFELDNTGIEPVVGDDRARVKAESTRVLDTESRELEQLDEPQVGQARQKH
ncbi:MAG TPA: hypothetical protein VK524_30955 [Polyangiaceae bacterium]|nr:hypothetical protein [Polyangiaceae bacterium]